MKDAGRTKTTMVLLEIFCFLDLKFLVKDIINYSGTFNDEKPTDLMLQLILIKQSMS